MQAAAPAPHAAGLVAPGAASAPASTPGLVPAALARAAIDASVPAGGPVAPAGSAAVPAQSEPLDLEALADHVLERLRRELRDGRERLGLLFDDSR
jgi:hypothetical protein